MTINSVPTPGDVRTHADEASREVVHVRLARGVADHRDPLGEHRRHHQVLGAGDRRHVERDARAVQAARAREVRAVALLDLGAHQAQPLEVLLDAAHADVVAARLGDARLAGAADQRAEQQERAAHPPAEVGVDLGACAASAACSRQVCRSGCSTTTPTCSSIRAIVEMSSMSGTLPSSTG